MFNSFFANKVCFKQIVRSKAHTLLSLGLTAGFTKVNFEK